MKMDPSLSGDCVAPFFTRTEYNQGSLQGRQEHKKKTELSLALQPTTGEPTHSSFSLIDLPHTPIDWFLRAATILPLKRVRNRPFYPIQAHISHTHTVSQKQELLD
jgi:hypothetical protein